MSFHIILPSNSCMDIFPDNTLSNFRVQLAKPIVLSRPYEVALEEILYPKPNHDFDLNETFITVHEVVEMSSTPYEVTKKTKRPKRTIPPPPVPPPPPPLPPTFGKFAERLDLAISSRISMKTLIWYLNEKLQTFGWTANINDGIFEFRKSEGSNYTLTLHPKLAYALGFVADPDVKSLSQDLHVAKYASPMFFDPHQMFVYGDFVEYQHVGGGLAPLLRICVPQRQGEDYRSEKYIRPYYLPVTKEKIDQIHVEIRTHTGKYFPFPSGTPVVCKLHFRPKWVP